MDSFIRNVCCLVFAFSLISTANAATTKPFKTSDIGLAQLFETWTTLEPSAVNVDFETTATTPQGQQVTRHTTRPVPLNKARLGTLARSATGGPAIAAASAAFLAYDYFFSEDNQEWEVNTPADPMIIDDENRCVPLSAVGKPSYGGGSFVDCVNYVFPHSVSGNVRIFHSFNRSCTATTCTLTLIYQAVSTGSTGQSGSYRYPAPRDVPNPLPANSPATDDQLGDAIKNAPHSAIKDILNDPISTGTWRDRWPEMEPIATDIEDTIGYDVEGTPTENYDPTISDGSTATPKPVTESGGNTTATEWPTFCSWAGYVCDFIDWFKEEPTPPETPDLPITEINPVEWESGLGAGSCPANLVVEMMNAPLEYDFAIPCWGASNVFQPILIFLSLIGAAYIIIGAKN